MYKIKVQDWQNLKFKEGAKGKGWFPTTDINEKVIIQ